MKERPQVSGARAGGWPPSPPTCCVLSVSKAVSWQGSPSWLAPCEAAPPGLADRGEEPTRTRALDAPADQSRCAIRDKETDAQGKKGRPGPCPACPPRAGSWEEPCSSLAWGRGSSPQPQELREGCRGPLCQTRGGEGPSTGWESADPVSDPHSMYALFDLGQAHSSPPASALPALTKGVLRPHPTLPSCALTPQIPQPSLWQGKKREVNHLNSRDGDMGPLDSSPTLGPTRWGWGRGWLWVTGPGWPPRQGSGCPLGSMVGSGGK